MMSWLLNLALQAALMAAIIWIVLSLLGMKWPYFRQLRRGYWVLLRTAALATVNWLWVTPRIKREGGGRIAQPATEHQEDEEWEDPENDDWL